MIWTDEQNETLRRLWGQGVPASRIAVEVGAVSRSAVIARATRMHLPARAPVPPGLDKRVNALIAARMAPKQPPTPPLTKAGQPCTIFELTESSCRFPLGAPYEAAVLFCGAPPVGGRRYCRVHCAISYHGWPK